MSQMQERCPDALVVGSAVLKGYRLEFTIFSPMLKCGCADIVPFEKGEVWGLLYEVSEENMKVLDMYEGHPNYYRRIRVRVESAQGENIEAETYEVTSKQVDLKPSRKYFEKITSAATKYNFPHTYQVFLSRVSTLD